jgi:tRNA threonylcarbamoyladenosine biosynthesis protein TsaE
MYAPGPTPAPPDDGLVVVARGPEDTRRIGAAVAGLLRPGDTVLLGGDLGAGKTTFTQGLAAALGVTGPVTSPTFVLVHTYRTAAGWDLLHADVWRLDQLQEVVDLAIPELVEDGAAAVIEWGERAAPALAPDYLYIGIDYLGTDNGGTGNAGTGSMGTGSTGTGSVGSDQTRPVPVLAPGPPGLPATTGPTAGVGAGGPRRLVFHALGHRWGSRLASLAVAVSG